MDIMVDPAAIVVPRRVKLQPFRVMVGPVTHLAQERERLIENGFDAGHR